ncbi:MAG: hypothetical protein M3450_06350, partial [Actinomycetota bacterium]|nr:hypothetical protein [Actinomycetota bacterium]
SYSATMRYNRISRNGLVNTPPWAYGAGIQVAHSSDVEVYGNVVEENYNGITVILQERGSGEYGEWKPRNVTVRDNDVSMRQGFTGAVQDNGDNTLFSARGISFQGNDYVVAPQLKVFAWANSLRSWEEWRSFGNDTTGTIVYR